MIVAFTGHRRLAGRYHTPGDANPHPLWSNTIEAVTRFLDELDIEAVISGMAIGVDQIAASVALDLDIPLHAYIPCAGQDNTWPGPVRRHYKDLCQAATRLVVIHKGSYIPGCMDLRNQAMVRNCTDLVAVWDGSTKGGTWNCIQYARQHTDKPIHLIDPALRDFTCRLQ